MKKQHTKTTTSTKKQVKNTNMPSEKVEGKSMNKISPLGSRVLIRPFTKQELEKKNSFGIILPDSNTKEKSEQGIVLAVGPGEYRDGVFVSPTISVGATVCFSKYGYDDITVDGEELYLIKEENILAVLK